jgi:hypothetical protein
MKIISLCGSDEPQYITLCKRSNKFSIIHTVTMFDNLKLFHNDAHICFLGIACNMITSKNGITFMNSKRLETLHLFMTLW